MAENGRGIGEVGGREEKAVACLQPAIPAQVPDQVEQVEGQPAAAEHQNLGKRLIPGCVWASSPLSHCPTHHADQHSEQTTLPTHLGLADGPQQLETAILQEAPDAAIATADDGKGQGELLKKFEEIFEEISADQME